jgi:hypothetical protein
MTGQDPELVLVPANDGLVCYVRHVPSNWVIRLMPWRDPDQPRFWCLRVQLSTGANLSARTAGIDPFYIALAMSRQDLTDTLSLIRSDPEAWFDGSELVKVREWLAEAVQLPLPPSPAPPSSTSRADRARSA